MACGRVLGVLETFRKYSRRSKLVMLSLNIDRTRLDLATEAGYPILVVVIFHSSIGSHNKTQYAGMHLCGRDWIMAVARFSSSITLFNLEVYT